MNSFVRTILVIYSLIISVLSIVLLYAFFDDHVLTILYSLVTRAVSGAAGRWLFLGILLFCLISSVWTITFSILSGRLSKTRIRKTDVGYIDLGVDAIESIALNAAKSAQVGIKSAKAHVSSGRDASVRVVLSAVLYSNVEVPAMMSKVQDRIKKDIERYTGIAVESVSVKVTRVEPVVAKVER